MNSALNYKLSKFSKDSPEYWEEIISQYMKIRTGITQSEFCKAKDISFTGFKRELYSSHHYVDPEESGSFREVSIVEGNENTESYKSNDTGLLLTYSKNNCDYSLRIPTDANSESLMNIFSSVYQC